MEQTKINNNIRYECVGICAISTAFNIFQLCDYRYVFKSSLLVTHEPQLTITGTFDFVFNYYNGQFSNDFNNYINIVEMICKKNNLDKQYYLDMIKGKDWILSGLEEILYNNMTDQIISLTK